MKHPSRKKKKARGYYYGLKTSSPPPCGFAGGGFGLAVATGGGLFTAHTRYPGCVTGDGALERLYLADPAAREARLQAVVEPVHALLGDQALERLRVRIDDPELALVTPLQFFEELVRFLVQAPGIDAEDVDFGDMRPDDIGQHHGLGPEAVRVHDAPVLTHGGGQVLADSRGFLFELESQQFSHNAVDYSHRPPAG